MLHYAGFEAVEKIRPSKAVSCNCRGVYEEFTTLPFDRVVVRPANSTCCDDMRRFAEPVRCAIERQHASRYASGRDSANLVRDRRHILAKQSRLRIRGDVQHDLLRRRVVAGQELFDQHLVQTHDRTACNAVLQPAERRGTRERPVFVRLAAGGQLQRRVAA